MIDTDIKQPQFQVLDPIEGLDPVNTFTEEKTIKQLIDEAYTQGREDERKKIVEEIKSVCRVHKYLPKEYENKVVGFIENLDKPQPTI